MGGKDGNGPPSNKKMEKGGTGARKGRVVKRLTLTLGYFKTPSKKKHIKRREEDEEKKRLRGVREGEEKEEAAEE